MAGRLMRATLGDAVLAESDATVVIEGNHYFPRASVDEARLGPSTAVTVCYWKGLARYHSIEVDGQRISHGAWYYPRPWPWIRRIRGHVAFGPGVRVREVTD